MDNNKFNEILDAYKKTCDDEALCEAEFHRLNECVDKEIEICNNAGKILDEAQKEFKGLTSIFNKKDISFFIFSLILQGAYKALVKNMRDMTDKELAKRTPFHKEEHSSRTGIEYYCSREEIVSNPVPFDAIQKIKDLPYDNLPGGRPGFNGFNHRSKALGHDPILGWIFGTANIMTSTITRNDFASWHVHTYRHKRTRNDKIFTVNLDTIAEPASTIKVFSSIFNRLSQEGNEGYITLGCALLKEAVHLFSDIGSRQSLPLPIVPVFSERLARKLSLYGLNTGTIVQGGVALTLINFIIGFLHGLCRSSNEDEELYYVRTKKIIMYSNSLATLSDIAYTLFLAYCGDKNALRKFDLGGTIVTAYQICNSIAVIKEIEVEYMIAKFNEKTAL